MKTSRTDGILVIQTKKPYKIAINGQAEDRTEIICHDVTSKSEEAAVDLEQLLTAAMGSIEQRATTTSKKQMLADEKKGKDFFGNNSPSDADIEEQAQALEMMIKLNKSVKVSELMEVFREFLAAGTVCAAGDQQMYANIWETVDYRDKLRIMYWYAAFFVNPLESLLNMQSSTGSQGLSEANKG